MTRTRDSFALALAIVAVAASALLLLVALLLQGWWMLMFTPSAAGVLFGAAGFWVYRPGDRA